MGRQLRSAASTQGRRMAGARALWRANGMKDEQIGKPIIAIVNSFTQFVPGHTHLHEIGQKVKEETYLHNYQDSKEARRVTFEYIEDRKSVV